MMTEEEIRSEIFDRVKQLYDLKKQDVFVPGTSYIPYAGRVYDEKELVSLVDASLDFWLTTGRYADQFEHDLAAFLGVNYCLLTNSGSSANLLAVSALTSPKLGEKRLNSGDEVITTACGFPTTLNPILQNNLVPVFLDVELGTYNIQANRIEDAISDKTKAIMVPHTLGNPVDLDTIMKMVEKYDLWFIEDNCDALGSRYMGEFTGTFGHISTCSFYPAHHITMGEGGAVLTSDPLLKKIIASFRDWGRDCWCDPGCDNSCGRRFDWQLGGLPQGYDHKYIYSHIGYNLKVTDMQAAIGVEQIKKLPGFIERRKENFAVLHAVLKKYEDVLILPQATPNSDPSWFGFPIIVREEAPFCRDDIVRYLEDHKIATRMLFGGNLLKQPAYADMKYRSAGPLPTTDLVMDNLFWIGVYPGINSQKLAYLETVVEQFMKTR
ncbi:lipopolysaccharide biosynthesis protein RfbH [Methanosphaerula palustris]|uniref:DegT/DnrJ/EryC1/StrS aminotransferase n=1 Tax=Methanosphaerula palustris (strain ATCC BAA-1556 / DSM 19958 / E1-9c) TaxID=521011 RepID=B8GDY3_METPE|nr:lipopolysaccharide biosynthesis protein RfbH [Methanosphaerula palustris]ACL17484.1 DegT/DnrJ/EryC1/StrS aminotransferase [Methanosphaerula palustris E1-9c]